MFVLKKTRFISFIVFAGFTIQNLFGAKNPLKKKKNPPHGGKKKKKKKFFF